MITRRETLALGGGAALATASPGLAQAPTLDALARAKGMRFGCTLGIKNGSFRDPRAQATIARECGLIVPENEMKWAATQPAPGTFDFAPADTIVAWAESQRLGVRGHTLLWHHPEWMPKWVAGYDFGASPRARSEAMIAGHIRKLCLHFGKRVRSWDVINEAIDHETGELRETAFSTAAGGALPILDLAFHTAREAAPHAELVYNDYMSWGTDPTHRNAVLRLLEGFRKRKVPVHALGLQSHIGNASSKIILPFAERDEKAWHAFLTEVTGMGYKLLITELDVNDRRVDGDFATRDRAVADLAKAYLDSTLSFPELHTIMLWGISDRYSWLQNNTPRADGLPKRCCPYDADFRPKLLRTALAEAIAFAPGSAIGSH